MTPDDLADLERDAERFRALERHATYGITTRPNGRTYLLYLHECIASAMPPPIECESFSECADELVKRDKHAKPLPRSEQVTMPDLRGLRGP